MVLLEFALDDIYLNCIYELITKVKKNLYLLKNFIFHIMQFQRKVSCLESICVFSYTLTQMATLLKLHLKQKEGIAKYWHGHNISLYM